MRTVNLLASAMHLLIVLVLFAIGFLFVMFYLSPIFFNFFLEFFINDSLRFLVIGLSIVLFAAFSFIAFYFIHKSQYVKFQVKQNKCLVNVDIIRSYLQNYLDAAHPNKTGGLDVYVDSNNRLEIVVDVESLDGQNELVMDLETVVQKLLSEKLNYQKDFILTLRNKN